MLEPWRKGFVARDEAPSASLHETVGAQRGRSSEKAFSGPLWTTARPVRKAMGR